MKTKVRIALALVVRSRSLKLKMENYVPHLYLQSAWTYNDLALCKESLYDKKIRIAIGGSRPLLKKRKVAIE